jgi:ATP-dependent RNA helicase DeaD
VESFEDLGLSPELVEALAAEGAEHPTPLQYGAVPIIRRGNNVLVHAGPGAGTLIAYGAGLLDRLEPGAGCPRALVVVPTAVGARRLAESLARIGQATGHTVASLGAPWVLPGRSDVLFATASDLLAAARSDELVLEEVQALVIDSASLIQHTTGLGDLELLLEYLPREGQRVVVSLPVTAEVSDFVARHVKRAVHVPPQAVEPDEGGPRRGEIRFRIVDDPKEEAALELAAEILEGAGARHATFFCRSEDVAADVGDFLTLHGYTAGAPGDEDAPVWLAVDELAALPALEVADQMAVVSFDVPTGPDSLDRRHGGGRGGTVLLLARELAHLRDVARRTGYRIAPLPPRTAGRLPSDLGATVDALRRAIADEDLAPYLMLIETVFADQDATELAAAALALLRKKAPAAPAREAPAAHGGRSAPAYVRLFITLGEKDGIGKKDLVGAIIGESGIEGAQIGKIETKELHSLVEVEESVAEKVMRALNGTTIRGRAVRVDYDRAKRGAGPARASRGPGPKSRPAR